MNTTSAPSRLARTVSWIAQGIAAAIMAQTLYFKFTAAEEPVYIFSTLGLEPMGRIGTAVAELVASILLLIPAWAWLGAVLGMGLMAGAIFFHLTTLGIVVLDDGGVLFGMGCVVFACCAIVLFLRRSDIPGLPRRTSALLILLALANSTWAADPRNLDNGLALSGYDPVSYFDGQALPGKTTITVTTECATYRFATESHKAAFEAEPAKYEPAYGGWCAWAMYEKGEKVEVDPTTFKVVNGRLFLFYNKLFINTLKSWDKTARVLGEATLEKKADAAWASLAP